MIGKGKYSQFFKNWSLLILIREILWLFVFIIILIISLNVAARALTYFFLFFGNYMYK